MDYYELYQSFHTEFRNGNIDYCIEKVTQTIGDLSDSPFHQYIELEFENDKEDIGDYFETFHNRASKVMDISAINPDEWYFD